LVTTVVVYDKEGYLSNPASPVIADDDGYITDPQSLVIDDDDGYISDRWLDEPISRRHVAAVPDNLRPVIIGCKPRKRQRLT
jgi:hypothetical protein